MKAAYPPEDELDGADIAAAKWSWENNHPAGRGSDTLPGARRLFLPLRTGRGAVGVLGLDRELPGPMLSPDQRRLLDALMDLAALAIERIYLQSDLDRAKLQAESERLRSALLTSISHDLGTPLASIIGAASSLKSVGERYDREQREATARDHPRRGRAAQPFRRQSPRYDQARIRRHRARAGTDRSRRDRRHARLQRAGKVLCRITA